MKYLFMTGVMGLIGLTPMFASANDQSVPTNEIRQQYHEIDNDDFVLDQFGVTVDEIEDMDVYGANGKQVGEVEDVLADTSNVPVALAIETGEFLGLGGKDVIVPFDSIELKDRQIHTPLTEKQMETLPVWDD